MPLFKVFRLITKVVLILLFSTQVSYAAKWNIVVLPEYDDTVSLSFDSNQIAYTNAASAIISQLSSSESNVTAMTGSSVGMDPIKCAQSCQNYVKQVYDQLKTVNSKREKNEKIDLVVFYHISSALNEGMSNRIVVTLRVESLVTGGQIFSDSSDRKRAKNKVITEADEASRISDLAKQPAGDVASVLAQFLKLEYVRKYKYGIYLEGFTVGEHKYFSKVLAKVSEEGGLSEETISTEKQIFHKVIDSIVERRYDIITPLNEQNLYAEIGHIFDDESIPFRKGTLQEHHIVKNNEQLISIVRAGTAHVGLYTMLGLFLVLFPILVLAFIYHFKHDAKLYHFYLECYPASGLHYLRHRPFKLLSPTTKKWQGWKEKWKTIDAETQLSFKQAKEAVAHHEYERAEELLESVVQQNRDLQEAQALLVQIPNLLKGFTYFNEGKGLVTSKPSKAAKLLQKVTELHDGLKSEAKALLKQAEHNHSEGELSNAFNAAETAFKSGNFILALNNIDSALFSIKGLKDFVQENQKLQTMRQNTLNQMPISARSVALVGSLNDMELVSSPEVYIGRPSSAGKNDIEIAHTHISRYQKQAVMKLIGKQASITDLGGANGTFVDGHCLAPNETSIINKPTVVAMAGNRDSNSIGPCRLIVEPMAKPSQGCIHVSIDKQAFIFADMMQLKVNWPSVDVDSLKRWICISAHSLIPISGNESGLFVGEKVNVQDSKTEKNADQKEHESKHLDHEQSDSLDPDIKAKALFYFTSKQGVSIMPALEGQSGGLRLNGIEVFGVVPLKAGDEISINQYRIMVK